jgi:hypothetical protein
MNSSQEGTAHQQVEQAFDHVPRRSRGESLGEDHPAGVDGLQGQDAGLALEEGRQVQHGEPAQLAFQQFRHGQAAAATFPDRHHDFLHIPGHGDFEDRAFFLDDAVVGDVSVGGAQGQIAHDAEALGLAAGDDFLDLGGPAARAQDQDAFLEMIGLVPFHEQEADQQGGEGGHGQTGDEFPAHREQRR